jgi:hypothetical protein
MDTSTFWTIASVVNYAAALLVIERILRTDVIPAHVAPGFSSCCCCPCSG